MGSWDPKIESADSALLLQGALLRRLIDFDTHDQLAQLEQLFSDEEKQRLAGLMKVDHHRWHTAVEGLSDDDIVHLIRFFAMAENLPGWEAGADSPVIPLAKTLRLRGVRLDTPLLKWLRQVNDNRYLPYGPL